MPIPVKYKIPLFLWMTKQCYINLFACNFPEKVCGNERIGEKEKSFTSHIITSLGIAKAQGRPSDKLEIQNALIIKKFLNVSGTTI